MSHAIAVSFARALEPDAANVHRPVAAVPAGGSGE